MASLAWIWWRVPGRPPSSFSLKDFLAWPVIISANRSVLDVWHGPEYAPENARSITAYPNNN